MSAPEPQDDVQEFAALLRRLKERTDRSYGSLARRLNMNTSTLHRYCAGDAVPVDFAPVERFAALCGASAEERMDLHRLWLSAVAARQRPRAGEAAGAPGAPGQEDAAPAGASADAAAGTVAATATEAAVGGGSGPGTTDGTTATAAAAPAADGGASATAGEVNPATAAAGGGAAAGSAAGGGAAGGGAADEGNAATVSDAASGGVGGDVGGDVSTAAGSAPSVHAADEGNAATASDAAGGDVGASDEGEGDALIAGRGAAPPRPWYRRRRVVMTAAAAVALLATLGSLSALPSGRSASDEVAQSPDPSSPTTATASGSPGHSPSKSPSPSATSGSPSSRGTRNSPSASATDGGAATKGTGKAGQQGTATGTPLTWTVNSHIWNAGCGHDYVIDKPPAQVPPPPTAQDAANWAGTLGAIHGRQTMVQISVQGRNSTAVVLEDLRVRVVSRGTPAKGNSYAMDQGCGGALTPRYFSVDLDKDRPIAHSQSGNDGENVIPAVSMPYRVSSEDPEVLLVTAETEGCDCGWYLELDWSSQGRTGTARIDDNGRPFRTTAIKGLPRYWYGTNTAGERAWVDYDS
ncbi:helix-turn-helix domain-containing protein [Streptomyces canus]|uniref:helix-turn-helix domain-containing protein n=1 Tax=Streptomyces canus TaxID=58343 RepID=UPI003250F041